jgi:uncharacterized membrane protein HdeD (DUF308 family)
MKLIIKLFGLFLILAGISLLFAPELIFDFIDHNKEQFWVYITAIVVRLFLGIILLLSAKASKHPLAIKVIGILFIMAALIFFAIGQENLVKFISSILPVFNPFSYFIGLISIAFGSFFIYSFSGKKRRRK